MRLINTKTGQFEEFVDLSSAPPYAVLSHTWDSQGEQSYQDIVKIQEKFSLGLPTPLDGEAPSGPLQNTFSATPHPEILYRSEPHMPTQVALSVPQSSHLSPSILALLRSLLIAILARASLYLLLGSSMPPYPEPRSIEVQPPSSSSPRRSIWDPDSGLSEKVRKACEIARRDGYRYMWIDSSCIDKTSSSELSEAINSMFNWYRGAQVCYAFLADVPSDDMEERSLKFYQSRWFQRAWTLQELIAPRLVAFLSQDWEPLGTKDSFADLIEQITHIDRAILTHKKALAEESVAERMRWASSRKATRIEDEAYSLLGIFGITMPTLYGEGSYAFRRLQEQILQRIPDQSLFAWGSSCQLSFPGPRAWRFESGDEIWVYEKDHIEWSLFASSPRSFDLPYGKIVPTSWDKLESMDFPEEQYTPTPYGIRTQLRLLPLDALAPRLHVRVSSLSMTLHNVKTWYLVLLGCQLQTPDGPAGQLVVLPGPLCKLCYITSAPTNSKVQFLHIAQTTELYRLPHFSIYRNHLRVSQVYTGTETKTVYIPHPEPLLPERRPTRAPAPAPKKQAHKRWKMSLSSWTRAAMRRYNYTVSDLCPTENHSESYSLTLFNVSESSAIHIQYRHMLRVTDNFPTSSRAGNDGIVTVIDARVWTRTLRLSHPDEPSAHVYWQDTPPYSSAMWFGSGRWPMTLQHRDVHLFTPSGYGVTLRLGFSLTVDVTCTPQPHFNAHVEIIDIATHAHGSRGTSDPSTQVVLYGCPTLQKPHLDFKLAMLGSVKRALETRGYSVDVEQHLSPGPNFDSSHSPTLIRISNPTSGFTVSIEYFHMLQDHVGDSLTVQRLIVAARVMLGPSSSTIQATDPSELYVDGPYVVVWADSNFWCSGGWHWHHELKQIDLNAPAGDSLTLRLGLNLAWKSEYYLVVDIGEDGSSCSTRGDPPHQLLDIPHDRINLTLPGHIKRALQSHGYEVHFEMPREGDLGPCRLTLSDTNLTINIEYSHYLSTDLGVQQQLTFRARVATLSSQEASAQSGDQIVDWDAWRPETDQREFGTGIGSPGWHWVLPQKDVSLPLPTDPELTLRLGFYLVWISEYCLTVEIINVPPSSPPLTPSHAHGTARSDEEAT